MTARTLSPVRPARPRLTLRRLVDLLTAADARYRARIRLASLDDRMLRDIGVTRGDLAAELRRPLG